jgi:signal peptide peptidase SppA
MQNKFKILNLVFLIVLCTKAQENVTQTEENKPKDAIVLVDMPSSIDKKSVQDTIDVLWQLEKDDTAKGLILLLNCSGGAAGSSYHLYSIIAEIAKKKPVVVFVENYALSGGYLISAAADYIIATPVSTVGSIGVISGIHKFSDLHIRSENTTAAETVHMVYSGEYKADTSPYTPLEKRALARQFAISQALYKEFYSIIAKSRNLNEDEHEIWANGKEFTIREALELNLIDQVGNLSDAISKVESLLTKRGLIADGLEIRHDLRLVKTSEDTKGNKTCLDNKMYLQY